MLQLNAARPLHALLIINIVNTFEINFVTDPIIIITLNLANLAQHSMLNTN